MESVLKDRKFLIITFSVCFKRNWVAGHLPGKLRRALGYRTSKILRGKKKTHQNLELEYST